MNGRNLFQEWIEFGNNAMEMWKQWYLISDYQKFIADNMKEAFSYKDVYRFFAQFAPTYLSQTINPWSFSLVQFTKEIKGNPAMEYKILTEVSGYGSQLGTIIDFLETLAKKYNIKPEDFKDPKDMHAYLNLKELAEKIRKAKGEGSPPLPATRSGKRQ